MTGKFFKIKCPLKINPAVNIDVDKKAILVSLNPMNFFKLFLKKKAEKKNVIESATLPKSIPTGYDGGMPELAKHELVQITSSLICDMQ